MPTGASLRCRSRNRWSQGGETINEGSLRRSAGLCPRFVLKDRDYNARRIAA